MAPCFSQGDEVQALYGDGVEWFNGKIRRDAGNDTFDILYDDGDEESAVPRSRIRLRVDDLKVGTPVEARYGGADDWFPGKVSEMLEGGLFYAIDYADGDREDKVPAELVRPLVHSETSASATEPKFAVGTRVEARFGGGDEWFGGVVAAFSGEAYSVDYDDGDHEDEVPEAYLRPVSAAPAPATPEPITAAAAAPIKEPKFAAGTRVEARFGGGDEWFGGVVGDFSGEAYSVDYDDGDHEDEVPEAYLRPVSAAPAPATPEPTTAAAPPPPAPTPAVVQTPATPAATEPVAAADPGAEPVAEPPTKLSYAEGGGACDTYLIDMKAKSFGQCKCGAPRKAHGASKQPPSTALGKLQSKSRMMGMLASMGKKKPGAAAAPAGPVLLAEGSLVLARFGGGEEWFLAHVQAGTEGAATYALKYLDGDDEAGVAPSLVRPCPKVGDLVEAKFGGGEEWFPGKLAALDEAKGLFSVDYDDGDHEDGVGPNALRLKEACGTYRVDTAAAAFATCVCGFAKTAHGDGAAAGGAGQGGKVQVSSAVAAALAPPAGLQSPAGHRGQGAAAANQESGAVVGRLDGAAAVPGLEAALARGPPPDGPPKESAPSAVREETPSADPADSADSAEGASGPNGQDPEAAAAAAAAGAAAAATVEAKRKPKERTMDVPDSLKGVFDEDEVANFRTLFEMYDADGSGAVNREEMSDMLTRLGEEATAESLDALMQDDRDGDGEIDFQEFLQLMHRQVEAPAPTSALGRMVQRVDKELNPVGVFREYKAAALAEVNSAVDGLKAFAADASRNTKLERDAFDPLGEMARLLPLSWDRAEKLIGYGQVYRMPSDQAPKLLRQKALALPELCAATAAAKVSKDKACSEHLKCLAEACNAGKWVGVEPFAGKDNGTPPASPRSVDAASGSEAGVQFLAECRESLLFFNSKIKSPIEMDQSTEEGQLDTLNRALAMALLKLIDGLVAYVQAHHADGLAWKFEKKVPKDEAAVIEAEVTEKAAELKGEAAKEKEQKAAEAAGQFGLELKMKGPQPGSPVTEADKRKVPLADGIVRLGGTLMRQELPEEKCLALEKEGAAALEALSFPKADEALAAHCRGLVRRPDASKAGMGAKDMLDKISLWDEKMKAKAEFEEAQRVAEEKYAANKAKTKKSAKASNVTEVEDEEGESIGMDLATAHSLVMRGGGGDPESFKTAQQVIKLAFERSGGLVDAGAGKYSEEEKKNAHIAWNGLVKQNNFEQAVSEHNEKLRQAHAEALAIKAKAKPRAWTKPQIDPGDEPMNGMLGRPPVSSATYAASIASAPVVSERVSGGLTRQLSEAPPLEDRGPALPSGRSRPSYGMHDKMKSMEGLGASSSAASAGSEAPAPRQTASAPEAEATTTKATPAKAATTPVVAKGGRCEANYGGAGEWFHGRVTSVTAGKGGGFLYSVLFDDGDSEEGIADGALRPAPELVLKKGDQVRARFGGGMLYFPATVTAKRKGNVPSVDLLYADGDSETKVPFAMIAPPLPGLAEGAAVEARYGGGEEWFPAVIARVGEGGGEFDLNYADGDFESGVPLEWVRLAGASQ